jgi:hypothetical protein
MPRIKECPKCGNDVSDSYEAADYSVGIMGSGWYCEVCDEAIDDDEEPDDYDAEHRAELRRHGD